MSDKPVQIIAAAIIPYLTGLVLCLAFLFVLGTRPARAGLVRFVPFVGEHQDSHRKRGIITGETQTVVRGVINSEGISIGDLAVNLDDHPTYRQCADFKRGYDAPKVAHHEGVMAGRDNRRRFVTDICGGIQSSLLPCLADTQSGIVSHVVGGCGPEVFDCDRHGGASVLSRIRNIGRSSAVVKNCLFHHDVSAQLGARGFYLKVADDNQAAGYEREQRCGDCGHEPTVLVQKYDRTLRGEDAAEREGITLYLLLGGALCFVIGLAFLI